MKIQEEEYRRICLAFISPEGDLEKGIDRAEEFIRLASRRYLRFLRYSMKMVPYSQAVYTITNLSRADEASRLFQAFLTATPGCSKFLGADWKSGDDIAEGFIDRIPEAYEEWNQKRKNSKKVP